MVSLFARTHWVRFSQRIARRLWALVAISLLLGANQVTAGDLTAQVDRQHISEEETLNLTLRYDGQTNADSPDFTGLQTDFDILSNSQSSQFRSVNGQINSFTRWTLMLAPKRAGKLTIPAFNFNGTSSQPIGIDVSAAGAANSTGTNNNSSNNSNTSNDKPAYLEISIDKDKVFVQEQLLLTVRLITSVNLNSINVEELAIDHALVKQVAETKFQKRINGKAHLVVETTYAVFPQQSGNLNIPALTWTVGIEDQLADPFGRHPFFNNPGRLLRLKTNAKTIPVLPQPSNYPSATWLPASNVSLSQSWSQEPDQFTVGEPITRTLTLTAKGLSGAQLPPLDIQPSGELKYYPDQPQTSDTINSDGITGIRTESYAIVPTTAGKHILPAVVVNWWDASSGRMQETSLPVQEIIVAAAADGALSATNFSDNTELAATNTASVIVNNNRTWQLISAASIALNLLLIATLIIVWQRVKPSTQLTATSAATTTMANFGSADHDSQTTLNEKQAFARLQAASQTTNPQQARLALLQWAQAHWQQPRLNTLNQIIGLSQTPALQVAIAELEASLYQGDTVDEWQGDNLLNAVASERNINPASTAKQEEKLPGLYPQV